MNNLYKKSNSRQKYNGHSVKFAPIKSSCNIILNKEHKYRPADTLKSIIYVPYTALEEEYILFYPMRDMYYHHDVCISHFDDADKIINLLESNNVSKNITRNKIYDKRYYTDSVTIEYKLPILGVILFHSPRLIDYYTECYDNYHDTITYFLELPTRHKYQINYNHFLKKKKYKGTQKSSVKNSIKNF